MSICQAAVAMQHAERLSGLHPDLIRVVQRAHELAPGSFLIVEGLRTLERQQRLVDEGRSQTLHSRHLTGHAVDLCDPAGTFDDAACARVAELVKRAARDVGVPIEWGGDWRNFVDTPHYQLPLKLYPASDHAAHATAASAPPIDLKPRPAAPVATAAKESRTILGVLLAGLGSCLQFLQDAAKFMLETAGEISNLAPVKAALADMGANVVPIGFGLSIFGVVLAVSRRLQAAYTGKEG